MLQAAFVLWLREGKGKGRKGKEEEREEKEKKRDKSYELPMSVIVMLILAPVELCRISKEESRDFQMQLSFEARMLWTKS